MIIIVLSYFIFLKCDTEHIHTCIYMWHADNICTLLTKIIVLSEAKAIHTVWHRTYIQHIHTCTIMHNYTCDILIMSVHTTIYLTCPALQLGPGSDSCWSPQCGHSWSSHPESCGLCQCWTWSGEQQLRGQTKTGRQFHYVLLNKSMLGPIYSMSLARQLYA